MIVLCHPPCCVIPVHSGTALWERYSTRNATLIMLTLKARRSLSVFHSRRVRMMSFCHQHSSLMSAHTIHVDPGFELWGLVHASV